MSNATADATDAWASHIASAHPLHRSHLRLVAANNKILDLTAAPKAAKEDKVKLLRQVEKKRKLATDADEAFYASVAQSTRYELPSPVYHAVTPPPSPPSPGVYPLTPTHCPAEEVAADSLPSSPIIPRPLKSRPASLLWGADS